MCGCQYFGRTCPGRFFALDDELSQCLFFCAYDFIGGVCAYRSAGTLDKVMAQVCFVTVAVFVQHHPNGRGGQITAALQLVAGRAVEQVQAFQQQGSGV